MSTLHDLMMLRQSEASYSSYVQSHDINENGLIKVCKSWMLNFSLSPDARMLLISLLDYYQDSPHVYPAVSTLKKKLQISSERFRKALAELVMNQYVVSKKNRKSKYNKPLYDFYLLNKCFEDSQGYGYFPRTLLYDPRFIVRAKLLYGLLCVHADKDGKAFPRIDDLCDWLGDRAADPVCVRTYQDHLAALKSAGYINQFQNRNERGQFAGNYYILNSGRPIPQIRQVRTNHKKVVYQPLDLPLDREERQALQRGAYNLIHARRSIAGVDLERIQALVTKYSDPYGRLRKDFLVKAAEAYNKQQTANLGDKQIANLPAYFRIILLNELRRADGEVFRITSAEERRMNEVQPPPGQNDAPLDPFILQVIADIKKEQN